MKARYNAGLESELYFFRDHHGLEVDLILNTAFRLHAMEIKASRTLDPSQKKSLEKFASLSSDVASLALVCAYEQEAPLIMSILKISACVLPRTRSLV